MASQERSFLVDLFEDDETDLWDVTGVLDAPDERAYRAYFESAMLTTLLLVPCRRRSAVELLAFYTAPGAGRLRIVKGRVESVEEEQVSYRI